MTFLGLSVFLAFQLSVLPPMPFIGDQNEITFVSKIEFHFESPGFFLEITPALTTTDNHEYYLVRNQEFSVTTTLGVATKNMELGYILSTSILSTTTNTMNFTNEIYARFILGKESSE
jgi:hypothetical protein